MLETTNYHPHYFLQLIPDSIVPYSYSVGGTSIYLPSKMGTVHWGFVRPPSSFILPSQTLCSSELISYPARVRFGEVPRFQGCMNI